MPNATLTPEEKLLSDQIHAKQQRQLNANLIRPTTTKLPQSMSHKIPHE